jgi:hypothetical protein
MFCIDSVDNFGFKYNEIGDGGTVSIELTSGENGNLKHVIAFVLACANLFQLTGHASFSWTPSRASRGDAGTGACVKV